MKLPVSVKCNCCNSSVMQSFSPENLPSNLILYCSPCAAAICTTKNMLMKNNVYRTGICVDSAVWQGNKPQRGAYVATLIKNMGLNSFIKNPQSICFGKHLQQKK